ncbi:DNA repair protein RecN [Flexithrix dorotheae]|uniref:DNA repair protein RecN n=1 Tax=Flexithrix dorotheae TaxID=70993 RepID=UPI00036F861B|nr:DNA repair protein RecN [Flexithrix dorotheae]
MLKHLLIKNYALINHLEIAPSPSLNIITGETGAGKSIMLGAIGLLLGNRADTKVLLNEAEKCIIEGEFNVSGYKLKKLFESQDLDYDETSVIRREITPKGKSRAFINDTPVNLETLKAISTKLVDIHSQHETLQLGSNEFQLEIIDLFAGNQQFLENYQEAFSQYKKASKTLERLINESKEFKTAFDYNSHLLEELDQIKLEEFKQEELEKELEKLENAENIKANLNAALEYLSRTEFSVESGIKSAMTALAHLGEFSNKYAELKERLKSTQIEIQDIASEIESEESELFLDHEKIQFLKDQLDQLYSLQAKHHVHTIEELISIREELQEKVDQVINFDEKLEAAKAEKEKAYKKAFELANQLSERRKAIFQTLSQNLDGLVAQLGMPNASNSIFHKNIDLDKFGMDSIKILFSANKGVKPEELKNVASGGEFSRLMLSIKYLLASKTQMPTIIFDEIDSGISGEIAMKVGKMMKEMGNRHQVIAISHLPQIAAKGDQHYFVYKDDSFERSVSNLKKLTPQERIKELAQMIGGANPTETAYQSARELMEIQ